MPLHNLGYREWRGERTPVLQRWFVIWETGVRLAWRSMWVRRMAFATWIPAFITAVVFFVYEQSLDEVEIRDDLAQAPFLPEQFREMLRLSQDTRHAVWTFLLYRLYRYTQGPLMVLLVGIIAPGLISRDLRSRAYLLYFSRPITVTEYLLGKLMTLWTYLALTITLPSMALYALGVLLSPTWTVAWDTIDLPLRLLASSLVLMIVTSTIALCFSSMTTESRYAGFAWFAMWLLGLVTHFVLTIADANNAIAGGKASDAGVRWEPLSIYHALGRVQSWIFGLESADTNVYVVRSAIVLVLVTVAAGAMLARHVQRPLHV